MFKWFHFTFTFCNYLAFEEDLVLYLSKLEIPQTKDNLYQVFIEIASTGLQNKIFNFSPIKTYKNVFPFCVPTESPLRMILTILNLQQLKFSQLCAFDISG
jgi:hypothetical protein